MLEFLQELMQIGYFIIMSFMLASILLVAVYILSFTSKVDWKNLLLMNVALTFFRD